MAIIMRETNNKVFLLTFHYEVVQFLNLKVEIKTIA